MKLMYALCGSGLATALHGSALHRRLAGAGAGVLQLDGRLAHDPQGRAVERRRRDIDPRCQFTDGIGRSVAATPRLTCRYSAVPAGV